MPRHQYCGHGDPQAFERRLLQVLDEKDIEYDIEYWDKVAYIRILFNQFKVPEEYEDRPGDFLHDIIYDIGKNAGFDPATCPFLEEQTDRWIFVVPVDMEVSR